MGFSGILGLTKGVDLQPVVSLLHGTVTARGGIGKANCKRECGCLIDRDVHMVQC